MPETATVRRLLRLYPRAWRERYGAEMAAMMAGQRLSARVVLDLLAGAVDARLSPQAIVALHQRREKSVKGSFRCAEFPEISFRDRMKGALWIVLGTAALTWLAIGLREMFGRALVITTLKYAAFPLSLLWSSRWTTMKPYSRAAQAAILGGAGVVVLLMCAFAASFGERPW